MEIFNSKIHKNNKNSHVTMAIVMAILLLSTNMVIIPSSNISYASTNTIEDFDQPVDNASDESSQEQDSSSLSDSTGSGTGSSDDESGSGSDDTTSSTTTGDNEDSNATTDNDDASQGDNDDASNRNNTTGNGLSSRDATVAMVNPNAYTYQTNPAENSVTISGVVPGSQQINTIVKNSFGQGVADIPVEVQVKDPSDKTSTLNGKTDTNGKNQINVPVDKAGTWTADVTINSPASAGGPFKDTISWEAVNTLTTPPPPQSTLEYDSKIAYSTVAISNDPRQQILTTVKDSDGTGVKDVELTIKLTNPDGQSATFSRITDANGVDEFVTPIQKEGTWKAVVNVEDKTGNMAFTKDHTWTATPGGLSKTSNSNSGSEDNSGDQTELAPIGGGSNTNGDSAPKQVLTAEIQSAIDQLENSDTPQQISVAFQKLESLGTIPAGSKDATNALLTSDTPQQISAAIQKLESLGTIPAGSYQEFTQTYKEEINDAIKQSLVTKKKGIGQSQLGGCQGADCKVFEQPPTGSQPVYFWGKIWEFVVEKIVVNTAKGIYDIITYEPGEGSVCGPNPDIEGWTCTGPTNPGGGGLN